MNAIGTNAAVGLPTLAQAGQSQPAAQGSTEANQLPSLTAVGGGPGDGQQPAAGMTSPLGGILSNPLLGIGLAVGGAALGAYGLTRGSGMLKLMGAGTALSGLMLTYQGARAKGAEQGRVEGAQVALQQFQQQVQQQLGPMIDAQNQKIAEQQAVIAQMQGGGGTDVSAGGSGVGTDTSAGGAYPAGPAQAIPDSQWTPAALVGQAVMLGEANLPSGQQVAEQGSFVIGQPVGDAVGYGSFAEADAVARRSMSTDLQGTKNYRWLVVEHDGRFHAFLAARDQQGAAPQLPADNGNVVGWHALRAVETGDLQVKWIDYGWSSTAGSSFDLFGQSGVAEATTSVAGGGAASGVTQAALVASLVGRTFAINTASAAGQVVDGGHVQLHGVVGSSAGYATPEEAAAAARADGEATASSRWARSVTLQLADGRFYAFRGQLVNRGTVDVGQLAAPLFVFGAGFAEYFDGVAWVAQPDVA